MYSIFFTFPLSFSCFPTHFYFPTTAKTLHHSKHFANTHPLLSLQLILPLHLRAQCSLHCSACSHARRTDPSSQSSQSNLSQSHSCCLCGIDSSPHGRHYRLCSVAACTTVGVLYSGVTATASQSQMIKIIQCCEKTCCLEGCSREGVGLLIFILLDIWLLD